MVAYCGWDPTEVVTDAVVTLDGNGTALAFLPSLHVTDVSAISIDLSDGSPYAAQIGEGLDVAWSENGTLRWLGSSLSGLGGFTEGTGNVSVTYSGGYAEVPPDLAAVLASLSKRMPTIDGAVSKRIGSAAITYASQNATGHFGSQSIAEGGLLLVEQMVFDRYRIVKVA